MQTRAPKNPSKVLLGLKPISLCLPNATPQKYAVESFHAVVKKGKVYHHLPLNIATFECSMLINVPRVAMSTVKAILLS